MRVRGKIESFQYVVDFPSVAEFSSSFLLIAAQVHNIKNSNFKKSEAVLREERIREVEYKPFAKLIFFF